MHDCPGASWFSTSKHPIRANQPSARSCTQLLPTFIVSNCLIHAAVLKQPISQPHPAPESAMDTASPFEFQSAATMRPGDLAALRTSTARALSHQLTLSPSVAAPYYAIAPHSAAPYYCAIAPPAPSLTALYPRLPQHPSGTRAVAADSLHNH